MENLTVKKSPLPWLVAGILLGLIQIFAIGVKKPLGVSTQFVVVDAKVINKAAPDYVEGHSLIGPESKYHNLGYGFWLDVGIIAGAFIAALASGRFRISANNVWWEKNHGKSVVKRFVFAFIGGIFILFGARMGHGCTSGQFASGWAQLALSAVPFTVTLFGFGMITARIFFPKTPDIE